MAVLDCFLLSPSVARRQCARVIARIGAMAVAVDPRGGPTVPLLMAVQLTRGQGMYTRHHGNTVVMRRRYYADERCGRGRLEQAGASLYLVATPLRHSVELRAVALQDCLEFRV